MVLIYFGVWLLYKCPELYVNGNITSWGLILLASIVIEGLVRIK
jgi:hypothetical protein